ncbi:MAG: hypothetical protein J5737_02630 [Bacteroidales bacterium]|nr:hypothetical protein [Bacteroidales bacterium]
MDKKIPITASIDLLILAYAIFDYLHGSKADSSLLVFIFVLISLIWQLCSFLSHFVFLKNMKPGSNLVSNNCEVIDYERLLNAPYYYEKDDTYQVLRNKRIEALLQDPNKKLTVSCNQTHPKCEYVKHYIRSFKSVLVIFLNQRWRNANHLNKAFVNDKKVCFCSEIDVGETQMCCCIYRGQFYNGFLTNTIFSKYIDDNGFRLESPYNSMWYSIQPYDKSYFSDHVGVSTLVVDFSNGKYYTLLLRQSIGTTRSQGLLCPSGSGSMDWSDFKAERDKNDFKQAIRLAAVRELMEETQTDKGKGKKEREDLKKKLMDNTIIVAYYRDLKQGGKPEFACVTKIWELPEKQEFINKVGEQAKEIKFGSHERVLLSHESWESILKEEAGNGLKPSLALSMNYKAAMEYLKV